MVGVVELLAETPRLLVLSFLCTLWRKLTRS